MSEQPQSRTPSASVPAAARMTLDQTGWVPFSARPRASGDTGRQAPSARSWIPACAGMSGQGDSGFTLWEDALIPDREHIGASLRQVENVTGLLARAVGRQAGVRLRELRLAHQKKVGIVARQG